MGEAAEAGVSLSSLYVDVVRPALAGAGREVVDSAAAALAEVAARPGNLAAPRGTGRGALVTIGAGPVGALDGQVLVAVLRSDGWDVEEVDADGRAEDLAELARQGSIQLVVMPSSGTYSLLRRLPDPPLTVVCGFGEVAADDDDADAFVSDPDELLRFLGGRLPATGLRNWGVQLRRRSDGTLVVVPTGDLDCSSVERLRKVVASRKGSFDAFVVDARHVAAVGEDGAHALVGWLRSEQAGRFVPGGPLQDALAADPPELRLVAEPADVA